LCNGDAHLLLGHDAQLLQLELLRHGAVLLACLELGLDHALHALDGDASALDLDRHHQACAITLRAPLFGFRLGLRGEAPFFALNIAAIPETLIESELFGHVRGAFTGAGKARPGHIRHVASGCLFLDEVGDLPATAQSKLLRVMETDRVTPLGSETSYAADVRYIAATHKDLRSMVGTGAFRQDLYERLAGHVIRLPALRERSEDILPIGVEFAERYLGPTAPEWKRVRAFLESGSARAHRWPGNVRELHNCLRNVMLGIDPGLTAPGATTESESALVAQSEGIPSAVLAASAPFAEVERWYFERVLARSDHNFALAARVLGVDRSTLRRKIRASAHGMKK
jgi:DNA-binding NtrC family response regulator